MEIMIIYLNRLFIWLEQLKKLLKKLRLYK
jgi:hypothetical protein